MQQTYDISIDELSRAFPASIPMPELLVEWALWLQGRPIGGYGGFLVGPRFPDEAPIEFGHAYFDDLALFLRLPDGSIAGLWDGGGTEPCVVGLGSEGAPFGAGMGRPGYRAEQQ